jgi:hypothetical protein
LTKPFSLLALHLCNRATYKSALLGGPPLIGGSPRCTVMHQDTANQAVFLCLKSEKILKNKEGIYEKNEIN